MSISVLAGLIPMFAWGIADFLQSIAIRKLGTYKTMFSANVIGILTTLPFLFITDLNIEINNFVILFIGALLQVFAIYGFYKSMEIGEISIVVPVSASYPLVTVFLLVVLLSQQLSIMTLVAIFVLIFGIILTSTDLKKIRNIHTVKGIKESLYALFGWGIYFFILDLASKESTLFGLSFPQTHYLTIFLYSNLMLGTAIAVFAILKKGYKIQKDLANKKPFLILLLTSVIYTVAFVVLNYGIQEGNTAIIAPISSLYPVITVVLAVLFYKEKLVTNQKIGIATILLGLVLISL